jgi:hypothetical protein
MSESQPPEGATTIPDLIGKILTKTFYGHFLDEVLKLSLDLERVVDSIAVVALGAPSEWAREIVRHDLWPRVFNDQKLIILAKILDARQVLGVDETVQAVSQVWAVRNQLAHCVLGEFGTEAVWSFEGYRRGQETSHNFAIDEIPDVVSAGRLAHALLADLMPPRAGSFG